jgi:hypothetical protein
LLLRTVAPDAKEIPIQKLVRSHRSQQGDHGCDFDEDLQIRLVRSLHSLAPLLRQQNQSLPEEAKNPLNHRESDTP